MDILQDLTPSRVALALDASKIASRTLLSTLPHAALHDEGGLLWFETGVDSAAFNGVFQTRLQREVLPAAIERVHAHFQQRHLPFHWHLGPSSQPTNFGDLLEAHGIRYDEDEPGMAADLRALNEDLPVVSNLIIQPVITENQVHQWSRTTYCGAPEKEIQNLFRVYSRLPFGPQSTLRLYLGMLDGEPVATALLFFAAGVAYVGRIVTVHPLRRRGIGAMMTLHAMREASLAGYRIAVLTASPMGINIYRRLGFKECCQISTYEWYPTNG
ncbi:MAG TPA: GNAT family N-acetyltransferase [Ktedonobacteraceae bacterium]|nr:GNAT family N-acetyltransferase [Ktedonobacteraceae bacterium]